MAFYMQVCMCEYVIMCVSVQGEVMRQTEYPF